jgi:hypothetical protein
LARHAAQVAYTAIIGENPIQSGERECNLVFAEFTAGKIRQPEGFALSGTLIKLIASSELCGSLYIKF